MMTISGSTGIPPNALPFLVGQVCFFALSDAPSGFLVCDGASVSRTVYAELFDAMGTLHGAGNGTTTFNLPDLRGEFIRGLDLGRGIDAGRILGSFQAAAGGGGGPTGVAEWQSARNPYGENDGGGVIPVPTDGSWSGWAVTGRSLDRDDHHIRMRNHPSNTNSGINHPRNVALLPCVYAGTPITANFTAATLGWQPNATILESIQDVGTATVGSAYVELVFRSNGSIGGTANANAYLSALGANYGANFEISVDVATLVDGYRFTVFGTTVMASGYQSGWFSLGSDRTISAFSNDVGSGVLTTEASGTIRIRAAGQASTLISIPFHLRATSNAD